MFIVPNGLGEVQKVRLRSKFDSESADRLAFIVKRIFSSLYTICMSATSLELPGR